ncbi:MAG: NADH-quinone oxidoreductase subunit NuoG [Deltaproteobacteria bacterium]|nr:NADH-quinone oxidoreductase subunit NuoG [Deltaproteobacteria bacterium]
MPKLTIDDREVEVPAGTKVIQAAERLGIMIPRFCYHEALGSLGACRMCAVKFKEGPVKGIEMSCMVEAEDGMVVSTVDPEAVSFRKWIIECLMLNHPLDCPVCDEGGHCLLQDETVSAGHGIRRYLGKKRTYRDQDLGPFVQHEMNRCIHCWRCRRFYQDFAGYRDLGAMQIANHTYFGRFQSGPLESPFSGNLIDLCPTGVYTDKPARFKGRRWDFERGPSLCIHCSLGCNTSGSARYREMVRQEGRLNKKVNGYFICDRGRFGFDFANHPDRMRKARVGDREVPWEEGIRAAADRLDRIGREAGAEAVLCVGSARCSLETQGALKRLCRLSGWPDPRFFVEPAILKKVKTAVTKLDEQVAVSMRQVEDADFILALGADAVNEGPMLALAMRQAQRKGATVAVIDPRPVFLPFPFSHLAVKPDHIDLYAAMIGKRALGGNGAKGLSRNAARFLESLPEHHRQNPELEARIEEVAEKLGTSKRPVIVCGTDIVRELTPVLAADLAYLFHQVTERTGLFYLLPGPNAFGAALLSSAQDQSAVTDTLETGKVKALVLVEQDPFRLYPDRGRLEQAMKKVECLIVLDYIPSRSAGTADVFLPTTSLFERTSSSFVNQEGRPQEARPIHRGGTPISRISGGSHPPRTFEDHIPGGDPKAAHEALDELYSALSGQNHGTLLKNLWDWLAREHPVFNAPLSSPNGDRFVPREISKDDFSFSRIGDIESGGEGMELVLTDWTFGTEELSSYSRIARRGESTPTLFLHPDDAARLGLMEGDKVALRLDGGEVVFQLGIGSSMAVGVVVAPRHRQVEWRNLTDWPAFVPDDRIHKM